jgi:hypothetical protein
MRVLEVNKVYDAGCHCAFTDMIRWRGRLYLTCREALNHSPHPSGQVVVLSSANLGESWQLHARLSAPGMDLRGPKFCLPGGEPPASADLRDPHFFRHSGRLGLVMPGWHLPEADRGSRPADAARTAFFAQSEDGVHWEMRQSDELGRRTLWRPRSGPDGKLYGVAYGPASGEGQADYVATLLRSADGWSWEEVGPIHETERANETDLCFLPDGRLRALVRREEAEGRPLLATSEPPYTAWSKVECDEHLKGPLLVRLPDERLLAVGRAYQYPGRPRPGGGHFQTSGYILDPETGHLEHAFTVPSGGDTSYAGYHQLDDATGLLCYYSGHEFANGAYVGGEGRQHTAIYVARLEL